MTGVFDFHAGDSPLLVSVPHDGREVPDRISTRMRRTALRLPDTDWHVARLYDFVRDAGASMIIARHSRYVVDLNRPPDDSALYPGQLSTGICPSRTFADEDIYRGSVSVSTAEKRRRITNYWRPYHEQITATLQMLRQRHGYALLWDAHSIPSRVPSLFDGELPVLNLGSNSGQSCARPLVKAVMAAALASGFSTVLDGRFTGGYITRHYGAPANGVHALQLEVAQRGYMREPAGAFRERRATPMRNALRKMLAEFEAAGALHRS